MKLELRDLMPAERQNVQARFESLCGKRFAPRPKAPRFELWWPRAPLDGRAFPEGIQPSEGDDPFNESVRLLGFLNGLGAGEFYVGNLSAPKPHFLHTGRLDDDLCRWIKTRLVSNPTCLLGARVDVLLIHDAQLKFSVLGATAEVMAAFEQRFGGAEALKENFESYVSHMRIGQGIDDARWAQDTLAKWSGWA